MTARHSGVHPDHRKANGDPSLSSISRRKALVMAAATIAAPSLVGSGAFAAPPSPQDSRSHAANGRGVNPLFLNTVLLGGGSEAKLQAARHAGFDQVELWTKDVDAMPGGAAAVGALSHKLGLGFTDYQVLLDFDGAPDGKREAKRKEALAMLDTATTMNIDTVLAPASTAPDCIPARVGEDLAWLVDQAKLRGRRIAYEGMSWSTINPTIAQAWAAIRDLDPAHAGLVLDSYHLFVRGDHETAIDVIPPERIFLAQFADVAHPVPLDQAKQIARHHRLLPGQGIFPVKALAHRLLARGYRGPIGLEVFNDAMHDRDPHEVAKQSMAALRQILPPAFG
jgi:4-hydroxyphenylpyruvate dioxygenase